jgi:hypothetical protein
MNKENRQRMKKRKRETGSYKEKEKKGRKESERTFQPTAKPVNERLNINILIGNYRDWQ